MKGNKHINHNKLLLIAGPCVVEGESICLEIAKEVKSICDALGIDYIFKASYKKANRSSVKSFTGIGDKKALEIIAKVKAVYDIPVTTDVHTAEEAELASKYVDVLQIPAFLCRQTDLLIAAGNTGKVVNIKKGQFMSPEAMSFAVEKVKSTNNKNIWLTERGTTFGYQDLIVDFKSIPIMQKYAPTIMDCTHALQKPNAKAGVTGGMPEHIETMAKAAVAVGVNGLFVETHPKPKNALSDGANMLPLNQLEELLTTVSKIHRVLTKS
jgi:2-dehydro-3-deoxyphosphooctonate aldolase (KDO 8-P synthase)